MLKSIKFLLPTSFKNVISKQVYKIFTLPTVTMLKPDVNSYSFSQAGEDKVLDFLFDSMKIDKINYLDLGTNHPTKSSNTYFFYQKGSRGVCVEAEPTLIEEIVRVRPEDKCLNIGVTFDERKEADFYIFTSNGLSTLSKEEAQFRETTGSMKVEKVIKIPLKNINEIIAENFDKAPELLSVDVEGIDLQILESLNYYKYRPLAICVETILYSEKNVKEKINGIFDFLHLQDYFVYADTYINTIFVDKRKFFNA